ncbi:MAG: FHA domain-containing protein, partial [Rhodothermales bacterium]
LEFLKPHCIACIGEDVPEAFLREMGLEMLAQGQNRKKFMVVNDLLETRQPNVYVIGDLLSQAYLRADDFEADPSSFELVKHRGNIKSALRDGVFVAEVIRQRMDGRPRDGVHVTIKEQAPAPVDLEATMMPEIRDLSVPPGLSSEDDIAPPDAEALLIQMTPAGVDEAEFALHLNGPVRIGRHEGEITFPDDPLLADPHVTLHAEDGAFTLRDEGSQAGTFYQLRPGQAQSMQPGDIVRVGQQFLVFRQSGGRFELLHYDRSGRLRQQALLQEGRSVLGRPSPDATRKQPDLALDHDDPTLSRFHVAAMVEGETLTLKDLESLNGTYLKVRGALRLEHDDVFRIGRQMLRLSLGVSPPPPRPTPEPAPQQAGDAPPAPTPQPAADPPAPAAPVSERTSDTSSVAIPPGAPEAPVHVADETALSITFQQEGKTAALGAPKTVLDAADEHDVFIDWECRKGTCGCDPIRVVSGTEHMSPVSEDEAKTLKDLGLEPGAYRLACVAKVQGPVVVETMN